MNPKCTGCHKRLKIYFIPAYGYGLFCETVNCPKWRFADRFADSSERDLEGRLVDSKESTESASFLKNDLGPTEGFCYHCIDCEFSNGFSEPVIRHSELMRHGVKRQLREGCLVHNKILSL